VFSNHKIHKSLNSYHKSLNSNHKSLNSNHKSFLVFCHTAAYVSIILSIIYNSNCARRYCPIIYSSTMDIIRGLSIIVFEDGRENWRYFKINSKIEKRCHEWIQQRFFCNVTLNPICPLRDWPERNDRRSDPSNKIIVRLIVYSNRFA